LICLGCAHAQPKKSAVPIFGACRPAPSAAWWLREVDREPAGQLAAREMEIVRIQCALHRAEELSDDLAAVIEETL
jgi:hypothetical protein